MPIYDFLNEAIETHLLTRGRYRTVERILTLTCVSIIRANVTRILERAHTPTQYSYIYFLLHQAERTTTGNSILRNQHAKAMRQPGASLYYNSRIHI